MSWIEEKLHQARTEGWKRLDLGNAGLKKIPHGVFDLDALEFLVLGGGYYDHERNKWVKSENQSSANQIALIPDEIARLIKLTTLAIRILFESELMSANAI